MRKKPALLGIVAIVAILIISSMYLWYPNPEVKTKEPNPLAEVHTNYGNFTIELYEDKVPLLTEHFLKYAAIHFYDGMIFHEIRHPEHMNDAGKMVPLNGSVITTGLYDKNFLKKEPKYVINYGEITANKQIGLKHEDMMVSWYHNNSNDSRKIYSQFYICNGDDLTGVGIESARLDPYDPVFGKVINGTDVVRKIGSLPVYRVNDTDPQLSHVPMGANNTTVQIINIHVYRPKSENFDSVLKQEFAEKESISNRSFFLRCSSLVRSGITISNNVGRTSV